MHPKSSGALSICYQYVDPVRVTVCLHCTDTRHVVVRRGTSSRVERFHVPFSYRRRFHSHHQETNSLLFFLECFYNIHPRVHTPRLWFFLLEPLSKIAPTRRSEIGETTFRYWPLKLLSVSLSRFFLSPTGTTKNKYVPRRFRMVLSYEYVVDLSIPLTTRYNREHRCGASYMIKRKSIHRKTSSNDRICNMVNIQIIFAVQR